MLYIYEKKIIWMKYEHAWALSLNVMTIKVDMMIELVDNLFFQLLGICFYVLFLWF